MNDIVKPRPLNKLVNVYLKIIPDEPSTKEYRQMLTLLKTKLDNPDTCYWSPELFLNYWGRVNNVLKQYNEKFIENDWAKAILFICIYDYSKNEVKPYLDLLNNMMEPQG
jgi:protoheme ferro-lyase